MLSPQASNKKRHDRKRRHRSPSPKCSKNIKSGRGGLVTDTSSRYPLERKSRQSPKYPNYQTSRPHRKHRSVSPRRRKVGNIMKRLKIFPRLNSRIRI